MRLAWTKFEYASRSCEGQVWSPDGGARKAVLFCPGFPGRGATLFEQRHAATLVDEGYSVIVLRHAGTRLDTPDAAFMVNNAARLREGGTHIGGGPSTMLEWLWEPYTALGAIAGLYDDVRIIGNSFGAVSMFWSLTRGGLDLSVIKTALCLAGAQGVDNDPVQGIMRVWNVVHLANPLFWEKITLDDPVSISRTMKEAYADIPSKAKVLPAHIALKYVVVEADEILRPADTAAFHEALGGRGEVIMDKIDRAYPAYGFLAHDTVDYPPRLLLEALS